MKKGLCMTILCLVVLILHSVAAYATESVGFVWDLLNAEMPENVKFGETVILADALEFSIPADWEVSADYDHEEELCFQFKGTDKEGRSMVFLGLEAKSEYLGLEFTSYTQIKNMLAEVKTTHLLTVFNGIDLIFAGTDEGVIGMFLTQNCQLFAFGFWAENNGFLQAIESEKLREDMTAILHSMKVVDNNQIMRFEAEIWEDTESKKQPASDAQDKTAQKAYFEKVTRGNDVTPNAHRIYVNETLAVLMPDDWYEVENENAICTFAGSDGENRHALVMIDAIHNTGMTLEDLEADAKAQAACCTISANGIQFFTAQTKSGLITAWLADDGTVYSLAAYLESDDGMQSEKLIGDLHEILCKIRPVYDGEIDQEKTLKMLAKSDHSEEESVSFQNAEFERMIREALHRSSDEPIYPSELAAIKYLSIRNGRLAFSRDMLYARQYIQPCDLDLTDLRFFPHLLYLNITDMNCAGFETLAGLPALQDLTLIRVGLTDCGFLGGKTLRTLNLAGNQITDFTPIASVKGLTDLNLSSTGLASLELARGFDLTILVTANNPIADLEPIAAMKNLARLFIQNTDVQSLEALRNLTNLEELNIQCLKGTISLEPLYHLAKLKLIYGWKTSFNETDRTHFHGILW